MQVLIELCELQLDACKSLELSLKVTRYICWNIVGPELLDELTFADPRVAHEKSVRHSGLKTNER